MSWHVILRALPEGKTKLNRYKKPELYIYIYTHTDLPDHQDIPIQFSLPYRYIDIYVEQERSGPVKLVGMKV